MFKIVEKKSLNPTVSKITVEAPLIAKKAEPGQFIIFRAKEDSERIPLTIADFDREAGTVTIIYQINTRIRTLIGFKPIPPYLAAFSTAK